MASYKREDIIGYLGYDHGNEWVLHSGCFEKLGDKTERFDENTGVIRNDLEDHLFICDGCNQPLE
jgi:hypothetical protein